MTLASDDPQRRVRRFAAASILGLVVLVVLIHRVALVQLRTVERHYVEARQVTACAIVRLAPFAEGRSLSELGEEVEALVSDATAEARRVRASLRAATTGAPFPPLARADRAVRSALDRQLDFYEHMDVVDAPTGDEHLRALGVANATAENRLARARSWLLVAPPSGWSQRDSCPTIGT